MEPAVRSPWIESAIITDRVQNFGPKPQKSRQPNAIWRRKPCPGERNFGCRDGRLKAARKTASATGDRKSGTIPGENPHRNGLSRAGAGICGFVGLDGGVRSQIRTGLHVQFPANREINKEFCDIYAFGSDFGVKDPCAAATSRQIPCEN
jgi:hypothetical protein